MCMYVYVYVYVYVYGYTPGGCLGSPFTVTRPLTKTFCSWDGSLLPVRRAGMDDCLPGMVRTTRSPSECRRCAEGPSLCDLRTLENRNYSTPCTRLVVIVPTLPT